jgi:LPS export ABC transporter protein LptC
MFKKKIIFFLIALMSIILFFIYSTFKNKNKITEIQNKEEVQVEEEGVYNSNIIENVNYNAKDAKGNQYVINADKGEIDLNNSDTIFLTNVEALIKLNNSENIKITSNFGKYNIVTYDTIFSKNVIIKYLDNKINGEYLDFSIIRNSMIVTKDVIYKNINNILKADVMEIDLTTKDIKIFMHSNKKKVNIKNIN